jgi:hypothetical protein
MAVEIGIATDYLDLLDRLEVFLTTNVDLVSTGEQWQLLKKDGTTRYFRAPGLTGTENIYIQIRTLQNISSNYYCWAFRGSAGWRDTDGWGQSPGTTPYDVYTAFWNNDTPYWFVANGQRVMVFAKVNTGMRSCYLGKFHPYATPSQYPLPLLIGAEYDAPLSYTSTAGTCFTYRNTSENNAWLYTPDNSWLGYDNEDTSNFDFFCFPREASLYDSSCEEFLGLLVPYDSGESYVFPYVLCSRDYGDSSGRDYYKNAVFGELDGVFYPPGLNQVSESIIMIDGVNYLIAQEGLNTGGRSFMAVRLQ